MRPIDGFLRTLFIMGKACARHMGRERPGVILTLSEPRETGCRRHPGHGVSSAGKEAFSRLRAAELAPSDIRVIDIRPHAVIDAPAAGSYTKDLFNNGGSGRAVGPGIPRGRGWQGTLLKRLPTLSRDSRDGRVPGFRSRWSHDRNSCQSVRRRTCGLSFWLEV